MPCAEHRRQCFAAVIWVVKMRRERTQASSFGIGKCRSRAVGLCAAQDEIALVFKIAGDSYAFKGDVRTAKIDTKAEGTPNSVSFSFHATYVGTA